MIPEYVLSKFTRRCSDKEEYKFGYLDSGFNFIFSEECPCVMTLSLNSSVINRAKDLTYILMSHNVIMEGLKEEEGLLWIDYVVNRSPYADCHLEKDIEKIYDSAYVVDASKPSNLIAGSLILPRYSTESFYQRLKNFKSWLIFREYMDENLAFIFSQKFPKEDDDFSFLESIHHFINPCGSDRSLGALKNWINNTPKNVGGPYNKSFSYSCIDGVWTGKPTDKKNWWDETFNPLMIDFQPDAKLYIFEKGSYNNKVRKITLENILKVADQFKVKELAVA